MTKTANYRDEIGEISVLKVSRAPRLVIYSNKSRDLTRGAPFCFYFFAAGQ
jgi:hypothetical protein